MQSSDKDSQILTLTDRITYLEIKIKEQDSKLFIDHSDDPQEKEDGISATDKIKSLKEEIIMLKNQISSRDEAYNKIITEKDLLIQENKTLKHDLVGAFMTSKWPPSDLFVVAIKTNIEDDIIKIILKNNEGEIT